MKAKAKPFTPAEFRQRIADILKPITPPPEIKHAPKCCVRTPADRGYYPPKREAARPESGVTQTEPNRVHSCARQAEDSQNESARQPKSP